MAHALQLDPEFRALLLRLADATERGLGRSGTPIAIVVHGRRVEDGLVRYRVSLATDKAPDLVRAMRRRFPPRARGSFRAFMGRFGDLNLVGACADDLREALSRSSPPRSAPPG